MLKFVFENYNEKQSIGAKCIHLNESIVTYVEEIRIMSSFDMPLLYLAIIIFLLNGFGPAPLAPANSPANSFII